MRRKNNNPLIETVLRLGDDLTVPIVIQMDRRGQYNAVSINGKTVKLSRPINLTDYVPSTADPVRRDDRGV